MPPPSTPQYTIAKPPNKEAGVLPISATNAPAKSPPSRLKVLIRRLPPGLTEKEFQDAIGLEWQVGEGKVDWMQYKPGKVSKDLAKFSRPARAYIHVTEPAHLDLLSEKFRQVTFEDARKTSKDPVLIGPPVLEFSQYQRIPTGRKRHDARQGLIDQDPEFIEFLESLTNPVVKPANIDAQDVASKHELVTVTPLIQHLRDKKAAKEKGTPQKGAKHGRQTSKAGSGEPKSDKKSAANGPTPVKAGTDAEEKKPLRRTKADKGQADTAAVATKKDHVKPAKGSATPATPSPAPAPPASEANVKKAPATAPGVARMIQRDLGLQGRGGSRGVRGRQNNNENKKPAAAASAPTANPPAATVSATAKPTAPTTAPAEPVNKEATKPTPKAAPRPAKSASTQPSSTSTQAFLKHANPSQGITEPLLESALAYCGKILKVEIDKRKGFAFVDFADPTGLQKAMADSPIKVAQGQVQVLERKERTRNSTQPFTAPPAGPATASTAPPPATGAGRGGPPAAATRGGASGAQAGGFRGRGGRGGRGGAARGSTTPASPAPAAAPAAAPVRESVT